MLKAVLVLNAIWFAMGFHMFYLRRRLFARVLVPREHRDTPVFEILTETGRFMGGFNLAFAVLNVLLLFNIARFDDSMQWAILLFVIAVAHGTQFAGNVPIALQNRRGGGPWRVFKGVMLRIFVIDFVLMVFNGALAIAYFVGVLPT